MHRSRPDGGVPMPRHVPRAIGPDRIRPLQGGVPQLHCRLPAGELTIAARWQHANAVPTRARVSQQNRYTRTVCLHLFSCTVVSYDTPLGTGTSILLAPPSRATRLRAMAACPARRSRELWVRTVRRGSGRSRLSAAAHPYPAGTRKTHAGRRRPAAGNDAQL